MKNVFRALLCTFTLISAYITLLFTTSLAPNRITDICAFALLGLAFDFLKCTLPAVTLNFLDSRRWGYSIICGGVCLLLIAFSLFASFTLFDTSAQTKIRNETMYQLTLEQNKRATAEYNRLIEKNYRTVANRDVLPIINSTAAELKKMEAPQTVGARVALIMNMILAILLEVSVFACHLAIRENVKKRFHGRGMDSGYNNALPRAPYGAAGDTDSKKSVDKSAIKSLSIDELATLIHGRGDSEMTYKQIAHVYGIAPKKIKGVKDKIAELTRPALTIVK